MQYSRPSAGHVKAEFELRNVSIGIWTTRRRIKQLLCLPQLKTFVLLIAHSHGGRDSSNTSKGDGTWERLRQAAHLLVDKRNPFAIPELSGLLTSKAVISLEIKWADIQGLDYICPLHQDGRLVLETKVVTRHVFANMLAARKYYAALLHQSKVALAEPTALSLPHGPTSAAAAIPSGSPDQPAVCRSDDDIKDSDNSNQAHNNRQLWPASSHTSATLLPPQCSTSATLHSPGTSALQSPRQDTANTRCHKNSAVPFQREIPMTVEDGSALHDAASGVNHNGSEPWMEMVSTINTCANKSVTLQPYRAQGNGNMNVPMSSSWQSATSFNIAGEQSSGSQTPSPMGSPAALSWMSGLKQAKLFKAPLSDASRPVSSLASPTDSYTSLTHGYEGVGSVGPSSDASNPTDMPQPQADKQQDSMQDADVLSFSQLPKLAASKTSNQENGQNHVPTKLQSNTNECLDFKSNDAPKHSTSYAKRTSNGWGLPCEMPACNTEISTTDAGKDGFLDIACEERASLHPSPFNSTARKTSAWHMKNSPHRKCKDHVDYATRTSKHQQKSTCKQDGTFIETGVLGRPQSSTHANITGDTVNGAILEHAQKLAGRSQHMKHQAPPTIVEAEVAYPQQQQQQQQTPVIVETEESQMDTGILQGLTMNYKMHTVIMHFRDKELPPMLSRFVKSDVRILKLYESGLPAWAVFLPAYGLWYRPWMRRVTWLLFTAISIISMAMGFYDLYKNVPIVRQAMAALSAQIFPPASQLFEWLEKHAQIRLSILLTYIFSKSPLFISLMRFLRATMSVISQLVNPLAAQLQSTLAPLAGMLRSCLAPLVSMFSWAWLALAETIQPAARTFTMIASNVAYYANSSLQLVKLILGPPARTLWAFLGFFGQLCMSLIEFSRTLLYGPSMLLGQCYGVLLAGFGQFLLQLRSLQAAFAAFGQFARSGFQAARNAMPAVRATGQTVKTAATAAKAAAPTAQPTWSLLVRAGHEAHAVLEFVRTTVYRCFKGFQAVVNGLLALALAGIRHRVSLLMQLKLYLLPRKRYLPPAVQELIQPINSVSEGLLLGSETISQPDESSSPTSRLVGLADTDRHAFVLGREYQADFDGMVLTATSAAAHIPGNALRLRTRFANAVDADAQDTASSRVFFAQSRLDGRNGKLHITTKRGGLHRSVDTSMKRTAEIARADANSYAQEDALSTPPRHSARLKRVAAMFTKREVEVEGQGQIAPTVQHIPEGIQLQPRNVNESPRLRHCNSCPC